MSEQFNHLQGKHARHLQAIGQDEVAPLSQPRNQRKRRRVTCSPLESTTFAEWLHLYHNSAVFCVRYSSDGQYLATSSLGAAYFFDTRSGQILASFLGHNGTLVRAVCISPNSCWLVSGAEDHAVRVWDVCNGAPKYTLLGHDQAVYSVDVSANSRFIISGSGDGKVKLWDLQTGNLLSTLEAEFGPIITSVSVSPTSQLIAAASLDGVVRVWDVQSTTLVRQFRGHKASVYSVTFSPDGRMLLSGSLDKTLNLWDLAASDLSNQRILSFTGHKDLVLSVAFCPNERWITSGSRDQYTHFWDLRQATLPFASQSHNSSVLSVSHNPGGKSFATGLGDSSARTWMYSS